MGKKHRPEKNSVEEPADVAATEQPPVDPGSKTKSKKRKTEPAETAAEPTKPPAEEQTADDASKTKSKKRKTELAEIEVDLSLPEPPSKKARRLLKKGKALPAKPQSDDEDDDGEDGQGGADGDKDGKEGKQKKKKERSPYGVWIGNLRFTVTKADVRKWLVDNSGGAITDDLITRVHMPMTKPAPGPGAKKGPENRGFAYVDFSTFEANVAAIALSETEWHGRRLLIKDAKNFEGRPQKEELPVVGADGTVANGSAAASDKAAVKGSTKIFVGNLSFNTTEDDLHAHFEKCGKIRWVKVATFEDSGKCKGYGWVNFEEPAAAAWAVKGFVKVRETVESLEDFVEDDAQKDRGEEGKADGADEADGEDAAANGAADDSDDSGSDGDASSSSSQDAKPQPPKKQPAKEPPRTRVRKWWVNQLLGRNLKIELAEDDQTRYNKRFRKGGAKQRQQTEQRGEEGGEDKPKQAGGKRSIPVKNNDKGAGSDKPVDINVARLTGAVVAHQGKKITFE
ncbi:hypothetical protein VTJ83DRAFT_3593 [Remersonia thermophila]|uniref:RRM domain-containing protein n=1 Tax=Remersonia thermophila TaxID=72144 RepID=A0ABR4DEI3_9PEZI